MKNRLTTVALLATMPLAFFTSNAIASDYRYGIEQCLSNNEMRVKIDHLQSVDPVITANDQALLDRSRAALKADIASDN